MRRGVCGRYLARAPLLTYWLSGQSFSTPFGPGAHGRIRLPSGIRPHGLSRYSSRGCNMTSSHIKTKDGTHIFYKDWGTGQPVVFSHGWPLNADAWDEQLNFFASNGYRAIAHDRRGHGR